MVLGEEGVSFGLELEWDEEREQHGLERDEEQERLGRAQRVQHDQSGVDVGERNSESFEWVCGRGPLV